MTPAQDVGELVDAWMVRAIGLSNHSLEEVARCHHQRPVDAVQVGLNLIDYLDDRSDIATYGEMGIAVTIYEPVASGILSGKTMEQVHAAWPGPWRESAFFKRLLSPGNAEKSFAVADGLRPIAARLNATVAQVAIAWVSTSPESPQRSRAAAMATTWPRTAARRDSIFQRRSSTRSNS